MFDTLRINTLSVTQPHPARVRVRVYVCACRLRSDSTGFTEDDLPATVKAQQLNPEVWGQPPGGMARLLVKDGPSGGELRITGVWRSLEAGSKLELEVSTLDATDCWGHVWSRKAVPVTDRTQAGGAAAATAGATAAGPAAAATGVDGGGRPSAIQWLDVCVKDLPTVRELKLATVQTHMTRRYIYI